MARSSKPIKNERLYVECLTEIKGKFKLACLVNGETMQTAITKLLEDYVDRTEEQCKKVHKVGLKERFPVAWKVHVGKIEDDKG